VYANWAQIWNHAKELLRGLQVNIFHMGIDNKKALQELGIDVERRGSYVVRMYGKRKNELR
jgi:hypothetical protein